MIDSFEQYSERCRSRIQAALAQQLGNNVSEYATAVTSPHLERLYDAMRYSLLNGGKRVRPLLV